MLLIGYIDSEPIHKSIPYIVDLNLDNYRFTACDL